MQNLSMLQEESARQLFRLLRTGLAPISNVMRRILMGYAFAY